MTKRKKEPALLPAPKPSPTTERVRFNHLIMPAGHVYRTQTEGFCKGPEFQDTAYAFVSDFIRRLAPRDPLEELLAVQALWAYGRVGRLSLIANQQESVKLIQTVNDAADRASNTFGRLMRTLSEYRRPPRGDTFMAIKQANLAQQQVVQNAETRKIENDPTTNEKGLPPARPPAALPSHPGGADLPAHGDPACAAVDAGNGATDGSREKSLTDERAEARAAERGRHVEPQGIDRPHSSHASGGPPGAV